MSFKKQQGATLLVLLIFLLILTTIGLSGVSSTILQEKMSSNHLQRGIAFQMAEKGLRDGEKAALKIPYTQYDNKQFGDIVKTIPAKKCDDIKCSADIVITKLEHPGQLSIQDLVNPQLSGGGSLAAGEEMVLDFTLLKIESTATNTDGVAEVKLISTFFVEE